MSLHIVSHRIICEAVDALGGLVKNGCTFLGSSRCMAGSTAVEAINLGCNHGDMVVCSFQKDKSMTRTCKRSRPGAEQVTECEA